MKKIKLYLFVLPLLGILFSCSKDEVTQDMTQNDTTVKESFDFKYDDVNIPITTWTAKRYGNSITVSGTSTTGIFVNFEFGKFGNLYSTIIASTKDINFTTKFSNKDFTANSFTFQMVELNESAKTVKVNFSGKVYEEMNDYTSSSSVIKGSFLLKYTDFVTEGNDFGTYAKLNSKDWYAKSSSTTNVGNNGVNTFEIHVENETEYHIDLVVPTANNIIDAYSVVTTGNRTFNAKSTSYKIAFSKFDVASNKYINYETAGNFNITEVVAGKYIKGNFSFTATNPVDKSVITVTNGTFKE